MQWLYLPLSSLWVPAGWQTIVLPSTSSLHRVVSNGVGRLSMDTYQDFFLFCPNQTVQTKRILGLMEGPPTVSIRSNCPDFLGLHTIDCNACLAYTGVFQWFLFDRGFQMARELICSLNSSPGELPVLSFDPSHFVCYTKNSRGFLLS